MSENQEPRNKSQDRRKNYLNLQIMHNVFSDVEAERGRQQEKWGEQNRTPVEWIAILTEEVGEASREAVDLHFSNSSKDPNLKGRVLQNSRIMDLRKEMIQVAAVAIQFVENIDRDQFKSQGTIYTIDHYPSPVTCNKL